LKNKAWGGRFKASQSNEFLAYGASIGFDKKLAEFDIIQNMAHAHGLRKAGILKPHELKKILKGLKGIFGEIGKGTFKFRVEDEDIHMNIERRLTEKIGPLAGKVHTGRSRNDQVATDVRLYTREKSRQIAALLAKLQKALLDQAEKNVDCFMPAYTHLQQAQPIRAAHWYLAYMEMFRRDEERFSDAARKANVMPLGSGALVGNNFGIDREFTARLMGFEAVTQNSLDGVSDRDFALEFCFAVATLFLHLSRFSEELVIYASSEFGTVILPDEFCTGSSIMPQKKNPDLAELFRGKAGRAAGNLMNLMMILKGLPLAYNKDMQEDKIPLFDSAEQALAALPLAVGLAKKMKFNKPLLEKRLKNGFLTAVDMADYLVLKGMPFRTAHHTVGVIVRECEVKGISFSGLTVPMLRKHSKLFRPDILKFIDPLLSPDRKKGTGCTSRSEILKQIKRLKKEF